MMAATEAALVAAQPGRDTVYDYVYSPDVDPTASDFDTEDDPRFPETKRRWSICSTPA